MELPLDFKLLMFFSGIAYFGVFGTEAQPECLDTVDSATGPRANHAAKKLTN